MKPEEFEAKLLDIAKEAAELPTPPPSLMLFNSTDEPVILNPGLIEIINFFNGAINVFFSDSEEEMRFPYESPSYNNVETIADYYGYDMKYFDHLLKPNEAP